MNLLDSGKVENNVKVTSVLMAILVHVFLAASTVGISLIVLVVFGLITSLIVKKELSEVSSGLNKFKKNFPFRQYGSIFGEFQHVFFHSETLDKSLYHAIESKLTTITPISSLDSITITDVDQDLSKTEQRTFIRASSESTSRGTTITLILNQSSFGKMQSIEWRVLCGGYIDRDKKFKLIAYSPFTFIFWILGYVTRRHDVLAGIRTIYSSSYNEMDIVTQIRCIHDAVFNAMIDELENNDIDTSELRAQKMQVMNISISGGKVNMGNVVQGAMNKVSSVAKGVNK